MSPRSRRLAAVLGFVLAMYIAEGTYYRYLKMGILSGHLGHSIEPS